MTDASLLRPSAAPRVARRRVHYFSGFDPRGAGYYHRLCRDELGKPQPSGHAMSAGRRQKTAPGIHVWPVRWYEAAPPDAPARPPGAAEDAAAVHTDHVFMAWDDIVRRHWSRQPLALAREFFEAYATILGSGKLNQARQISPITVFTGLSPALFALVTVLLSAAAGLGAARLLAAAWPHAPAWLPALAGLGAAAAAWRGGLALGERLGLLWLMHIFAFVARLGRGQVPDLAPRAHRWVEQIIAEQQAEPVDEVVLVGHSVGTLVMVDVVDRLLADPRWQALQTRARTGMLTLGHCYPFVALLPGAARFRAGLQRLSTHPGLAWVDVSARIDALCFHQTHPLAGTGVDTRPLPNPVLRTARFFQMYHPEHWSRIRRDKQRTHFLYLMTPDRRGNFDLFETLYGPRPFGQPASQEPAL